KSRSEREWGSRLERINDALQELKPPPPEPTEGDVRDRIVALLEHVARTVAASPWSSCLPALIDAAERDPECRELHNRMSRAGRQRLVDLLVCGQAPGEIPADLDVEVMADALAGPIFMRRLMGDAPLDPAAVPPLLA